MNNLDAVVNQILSEAFEESLHDTGPNNATVADTNMSARGGIQRQMLAGELVSSPAYFTQMPTSDMAQKLSGALDGQSKIGLGELVTIGQSVSSFVEAYLADTVAERYTNPNNVDYLINALEEAGYSEYASAVDAITLNPTIDDVAKLNSMVENLSKDAKNNYFAESLVFIAEQIVEETEQASGDSGETGENNGKGTEPESESPSSDAGAPEGSKS